MSKIIALLFILDGILTYFDGRVNVALGATTIVTGNYKYLIASVEILFGLYILYINKKT